MTQMPAPGAWRQAFAPAKVNLFLHITGRREDGYHQLESVFVFADRLGDQLSITPAPEFGLSIDGPQASSLSHEAQSANLVHRAALAAWAVAGRTGLPPYRFRLSKHLPVAAGLGGGSSDAAACLRLLDQVADLGLSQAQLDALALELGADVPACLTPQAAWISGIGEQRQPLADFPSLPAVLVNPRRPVSTADVFRARPQTFQAARALPAPDSDWRALLAASHNDLQATAIQLEPSIGACLHTLRATKGAWRVAMSGSGGSCFALYDSLEQAETAASNIRAAHPDWWCAACLLG